MSQVRGWSGRRGRRASTRGRRAPGCSGTASRRALRAVPGGQRKRRRCWRLRAEAGVRSAAICGDLRRGRAASSRRALLGGLLRRLLLGRAVALLGLGFAGGALVLVLVLATGLQRLGELLLAASAVLGGRCGFVRAEHAVLARDAGRGGERRAGRRGALRHSAARRPAGGGGFAFLAGGAARLQTGRAFAADPRVIDVKGAVLVGWDERCGGLEEHVVAVFTGVDEGRFRARGARGDQPDAAAGVRTAAETVGLVLIDVLLAVGVRAARARRRSRRTGGRSLRGSAADRAPRAGRL